MNIKINIMMYVISKISGKFLLHGMMLIGKSDSKCCNTSEGTRGETTVIWVAMCTVTWYRLLLLTWEIRVFRLHGVEIWC